MKGDLTRVVLVDDHVMIREALASFLSDSQGVEVVAQGSDVSGAIAAVRLHNPDVLVLDYVIPGGGALPVIETVREQEPPCAVVILTVHESVHYAVKVLEHGASGFIVKSSAINELLDAIETVKNGGIHITPKLNQEVLKELMGPRLERSGLGSLSTREFELLRLLTMGKSLKDSASDLGVSASTASTYRGRILNKLGLSTTGELIRFGIENGISLGV